MSIDFNRLENHDIIRNNAGEARKALDDMDMNVFKLKNINIKQDEKPLSARPPQRSNLINP